MIATWLSFFWRSQWLVAIYLIGADWNHGISHDFPRKYWEFHHPN